MKSAGVYLISWLFGYWAAVNHTPVWYVFISIIFIVVFNGLWDWAMKKTSIKYQ